MKLRYRVHSAHNTHLPVAAKTQDGREVMAPVPALLVELVPDGDHRHAVSLDIVSASPEAHAAALAEFAEGNIIVLDAAKE